MKQELAQDIALMRYSMISPLIVGLPDEYRSKEAYFRAASARGALHPNGFFIHPAPTSINAGTSTIRRMVLMLCSLPAAATRELPERSTLTLRNRSDI